VVVQDDGEVARVRAGPRRRRWAAWSLLGAVAVILAVGVGFVGRLFSSPASAEPFDDGPIVVLGGGGPERLATAMAIRGDDRRLLLVSAEAIERFEAAGGSCDDAEVACLLPEPPTTHGEARTVGALARQLGWPHVTVVTSDFHTTRTRLLFDRCVDVPVVVVPASTDPDLGERLYRIARETAATVVALTRRSCT
jgi:uncharacterized SAM-binding protein YcdF (DUF218 family)